MVFYGGDGLDELTTTTTSTVHELADGALHEYLVDPLDLGIPRASRRISPAGTRPRTR